ncbi:uncharacterized protein BO80DRAFT_267625 [Aspergillus ibericus CBS 121593]|uniref:Zn(2)-C6 fungal-type domain-containing protein n=1 Tax=Aspergillus ibericus CBS 121593 TaxID=1448316 RepID=A0A395H7Q3_9EURO|nr:hypothetical protein BO80DRAFT_267625 [Aspergillus ibericus CBS 121593]RAL03690.1 hypothetical protein BO80DRAFT_267625 [Aspergillus ibericus CBS 121593]
MVRVPRGCQACADAHLQCDGKSPCGHCKGRLVPCFSQARTFKFRNEGPGLQQRYRSSPPSSSTSPPSNSTPPSAASTATTTTSSPPPRPGPARGRDVQFAPVPLPVPLPMDETVSPSLTVTAVAAQQTQVFTNYVLTAFPCFFKCTETRVPVNWVEYVDRRRGAMNSCFDWAIRACTLAYSGALYNIPEFHEAARAFYTRSLRGLASLIADESTAKSDEALSTAIVLAVFEKHHCTEPQAWIHHAHGIRALLKLRGPKAHLHGFGRAMYIVYRPILIAAALIEGEACFLEEPEWHSLNEQISTDNAKLPDSSLYTDVVDRGLREIIKIPGYVKRIRELLALPLTQRAKLEPPLLQSIQATRAALRGIHTEFGVSISMLRAGHAKPRGFIGPLPEFFFEGYSAHVTRGVHSALLILDYLVVMLDPSQRSTLPKESLQLCGPSSPTDTLSPTPSDDSPMTPPGSPGQPQLVVESLITPTLKQGPTTDWMDQLTSTMGMDGVRVRIVDVD